MNLSKPDTPIKVFIKAKVHRTNIWPFGVMQTIVLCGNKFAVHDIRYVSPEQIVELTPKEVAELSVRKEKGDGSL